MIICLSLSSTPKLLTPRMLIFSIFAISAELPPFQNQKRKRHKPQTQTKPRENAGMTLKEGNTSKKARGRAGLTVPGLFPDPSILQCSACASPQLRARTAKGAGGLGAPQHSARPRTQQGFNSGSKRQSPASAQERSRSHHSPLRYTCCCLLCFPAASFLTTSRPVPSLRSLIAQPLDPGHFLQKARGAAPGSGGFPTVRRGWEFSRERRRSLGTAGPGNGTGAKRPPSPPPARSHNAVTSDPRRAANAPRRPGSHRGRPRSAPAIRPARAPQRPLAATRGAAAQRARCSALLCAALRCSSLLFPRLPPTPVPPFAPLNPLTLPLCSSPLAQPPSSSFCPLCALQSPEGRPVAPSCFIPR